MSEFKQWTKEELEQHIKINVTDYSAAVVVAALYYSIFGEMPKIGLSGHQGSGAEYISKQIEGMKDETNR
jgi:hypothetical protein